jgi:hypothetical protein
MDDKLLSIREFQIGTAHTISTGNYENIKVEAHIKFGLKVGYTEEELRECIKEAQARLKEILRETYVSQKRQKQAMSEYTA